MGEHWFENNNHVGNQNDMRLSDKLCDVIIKVNEKEFPAHKVILASNLKYFGTMFLNSFQESNLDVVTMQGVRETDLEAFIMYAYPGKILLTEKNALNLFELANYLTEDSIKHACVDFLKIHLRKEDACLAYKLANSTECFELKNVAKQVVLSNFKDCSLIAEYLSLDFESLKDILSCNTTDLVQSQQILFEGIARWILHDAESRRPHVNDVLNQIEITKVKQDYLFQFCCEWIEDQWCRDIINDIMIFYHTKSQLLQTESLKQSLMVTGRYDNKTYSQFYDFMEKKWGLLHEMSNLDNKFINRGTIFDNSFYYTVDKIAGETKLGFQIFNPTFMETTVLTSDCNILEYPAVCASTKILYFCGGRMGNGPESGRILTYEPERNLFEILPSMLTHRFYAASIFFQGCLFVMGGYGSGTLDTVEKYDPDTKVWATAPSMRVGRYWHAVAALDEKIYVCGGFDDNSVEVYDPVINSWQFVASMNKPRNSFFVVAYKGKLLAMGGDNEKTVEVYDPIKNNWQIDVQMSSGLQVKHPRGGLIPTICVHKSIL